MPLPNFFIAGTPKSGTTSLYYYLNEHPEIFMCSVKEPNYFSHQQIASQNLYYSERGIRNYKEYISLFKEVTFEKAIGEASVSYLFYDMVPAKIKKSIPSAKIIIILRNPVERCFSHYLMDFRLGYIKLPFDDICYKRTKHPLLPLYYQQFVEMGFYYEQIKRYIDVFGREQVKFFLYEDFNKDICGVIKSVYGFLDVDPNVIPNISTQYNVYQRPKSNVVKYLYSYNFSRRSMKKIVPYNLLKILERKLFLKENKPKLPLSTQRYLNGLFKENMLQTAELLDNDRVARWCE
jgi:hypothetical protein